MSYIILSIIFLSFAIVTWRSFRWGTGIFMGSLPVLLAVSEHILRFKIGPMPTTLIEVFLGILIMVWLVRFFSEDSYHIRSMIKEYRWGSVLTALFFVASCVSIIVSGEYISAIGIWRAYFLEPLIFFCILLGRTDVVSAASKNNDPHRFSVRFLIMSLIVSTLSIVLYAVYQSVVGDDLFSQGLGRPVIHRVTSFFTSPNSIGLYTVPIMIVLFGEILKEWRGKHFRILKRPAGLFFLVVLVLNSIALVLSKSDGALIACGAGFMTVLFFLGFRKSVIIGAVMVFIIAISIPRVREAVFFQDAAGKNRLALWSFSWDYATASPYQFVFGAGLRQFHQKVQAPALHFNFTKMEKLIYPHTTLFNFWMETGLLGALSFIGLTAYQMYLSLKTWEKNIDLGSVMVGMVVAMVVQGLVDVPYFKNDLAVVWWGLFAILVCAMLSDVNSKSVES